MGAIELGYVTESVVPTPSVLMVMLQGKVARFAANTNRVIH